MSNSSKKNIIIIAAAAVILAGGTAVYAISQNSKSTSESVLTLAQRYLSEQNYQQAVIEFQRILEIDPMNAEAYLGLAEAYLGLGDAESAIAALQKGCEETGDADLLARLNELTGEWEEPAIPAQTEENHAQTEENPAQTEENPAVQSEEEQDVSQSDSGSAMISNVLNSIFAADGEYDRQRLSSVEQLFISYLYTENKLEVLVLNLDGSSEKYSYDYEYSTQNAVVLDGTCLNYMSNVRIIDIFSPMDIVLNDLTFVENTPNLEFLQARVVGVSDLSSLSNAKNLYLVNLMWSFEHEQINLDISPLADLPLLDTVGIQGSENVTVSDLSPLQKLPLLGYLELTVSAGDYSVLEGLKLKTLGLPASCPEETVSALRAALPECEITVY